MPEKDVGTLLARVPPGVVVKDPPPPPYV